MSTKKVEGAWQSYAPTMTRDELVAHLVETGMSHEQASEHAVECATIDGRDAAESIGRFLTGAVQRGEWLKRKAEGKAVDELLAPLPTGSEFKLDDVAGAYRSLYRKNGEGLWDQVQGTCQSPHVINMSAEHLGFVVGLTAIRQAIAERVDA